MLERWEQYVTMVSTNLRLKPHAMNYMEIQMSDHIHREGHVIINNFGWMMLIAEDK